MEDSTKIADIKLVMKKTGINYEKAEKLLSKSNVNPEKAIEKYNRWNQSIISRILKWLIGTIQYKLVVRGKNTTFIRMPLWLLLILGYLLYRNGTFESILKYSVIAGGVFLLVVIIFNLEILISNKDIRRTVSLVRKTSDYTITADKEYEVEEDSNGVLRINVRD